MATRQPADLGRTALMRPIARKLKAIPERLYLSALGLIRWIRPGTTVWIYQMGKVASSSIHRSLRRIPCLQVTHVHRVNPENIARVQDSHRRRSMAPPDERVGLRLGRKVAAGDLQGDVHVITLVREPVGRNVSAFFENLAEFEQDARAYNHRTADELVSDFLDLYDHDTPLTWFDAELRAVTGVDV